MNSRARKICFRGKVEYRDAAASLLKEHGDSVIVERGKPRLLIIRCPCGCGDDLIINIDKRVGPAWRYYRNQHGLSLYPSYWRDTACGSHFIIWNNHIYWCSGWESEEIDDWSVSQSVENSIWNIMSEEHFRNYEDMADQLDLIPWEALQACRQLVRRGLADGSKWPRGGRFKKRVGG
jgi:uncharacterized protein DUF6527